jgi:hypothetical protein
MVMSGLAMLVLLAALTTGWGKGDGDEGAAAHLWQLLIGLQIPLILAFIVTADWRKPMGPLKVLVLQGVLLALAMAPVAILHL